MSQAIRSEWLKIRTTRMNWGLLVTAVVYTVINAATIIALADTDFLGEASPSLMDPAGLRLVYSTVGSSVVLALVTGILGMTSEFRHMTITATLLATPDRTRLVTAKSLAHAAFGALMGLACVVGALLALFLGMLVKPHAGIDWPAFLAIVAGALLAFAIYTVVGVAFGALIRNQIAAIIIALIWILLVEALIVGFLPDVGRWLPGGAMNGLLQAPDLGGVQYLGVIPSAVLLLGYGVVFAVLGARLTLRRDIT